MGKMKEIFMKEQEKLDLDREYLIDDVLAQEQSYNEFLKLRESSEFNSPLNSKIQVGDGKTTRIEINQEKQELNRLIERE